MTNSRFSGLHHRFRPWFIVWLIIMWCMLMGEVTVGNLVAVSYTHLTLPTKRIV